MTASSAIEPVPHRDETEQLLGPDLSNYRRIVILTEGHTAVRKAKTAIGLLRYRRQDILALLDSTTAGATAESLLGQGGTLPVIARLADADRPDALFVGISPAGGRFPAEMRQALVDAVEAGIDVISGMHEFLTDDAELRTAAERTGSRLIDVRRNDYRETAVHAGFPKQNVRVHTVGHDCSVGKMVTALEVTNYLEAMGNDAKFLATGQTGMMISGRGVPVDCVVSDFVNGTIENLVKEHEHHDYLLVEGQGSIVHPAFSAVTLGLLHGCAPHGLILCYEAGRKTVKNLDHVPIRPLAELKALYETIASMRHPCEVIGISLNGLGLTPDQLVEEKGRISGEFGLPVCDVFHDGPSVLADAVLKLGSRVRG